MLCTVFAAGSFGIGYPSPGVVTGSGNLGAFVLLSATGTFFVLCTVFAAGSFGIGYPSPNVSVYGNFTCNYGSSYRSVTLVCGVKILNYNVYGVFTVCCISCNLKGNSEENTVCGYVLNVHCIDKVLLKVNGSKGKKFAGCDIGKSEYGRIVFNNELTGAEAGVICNGYNESYFVAGEYGCTGNGNFSAACCECSRSDDYGKKCNEKKSD